MPTILADVPTTSHVQGYSLGLSQPRYIVSVASRFKKKKFNIKSTLFPKLKEPPSQLLAMSVLRYTLGVATLEQSLSTKEAQASSSILEHKGKCNKALSSTLKDVIELGDTIVAASLSMGVGELQGKHGASAGSQLKTAITSIVQVTESATETVRQSLTVFTTAFNTISRSDEELARFSISEITRVFNRVDEFRVQQEIQIADLNRQISSLDQQISLKQSEVNDLQAQIQRSHVAQDNKEVTRGLNVAVSCSFNTQNTTKTVFYILINKIIR